MIIRLLLYLTLLFLPLCLSPLIINGNESTHKEEKFQNLSIHSIFLEADLCTENVKCLDTGLWVKSVDFTGNIVITGHSFTLFPLKSGVFANLNKVKIGDIIYLYLHEEEYVYKVVDRFVTKPEDTRVESQEFVQSLTLYTCYPIMTANYRYIVRAELIH